MEIVLNGLDFGMDVRQAVDAPRFHHQWMPDEITFERNALPDSTTQRAAGDGSHASRSAARRATDTRSSCKNGVAYGANDQRSSDSKASVP